MWFDNFTLLWDSRKSGHRVQPPILSGYGTRLKFKIYSRTLPSYIRTYRWAHCQGRKCWDSALIIKTIIHLSWGINKRSEFVLRTKDFRTGFYEGTDRAEAGSMVQDPTLCWCHNFTTLRWHTYFGPPLWRAKHKVLDLCQLQPVT